MTRHDLLVEHVLGVLWNSESDNIGYESTVPERRLTRRAILSVVSSVYDPLGFISPFILAAKKMTQELCRRSISWGENLLSDILTSWMKWMEDLPKLNQTSLPRCMKLQRVTDARSLKFVCQQENCESVTQYFQFWSHTVSPPIPIKIIMLHWVIRPIIYYALRAALVAMASSRLTAGYWQNGCCPVGWLVGGWLAGW